MQNKGAISSVYNRLLGIRPEICAVLAAAFLYQPAAYADPGDKPQLLELPASGDSNASIQKQQPAPLQPVPDAGTQRQAPAGNNTAPGQMQLLPLPDAPATPAAPSSATPAIPVPAAVAPAIPTLPQPIPSANNGNAGTTLPVTSISPQGTANAAIPIPAAAPPQTGKTIDSDLGTSASHDPNLSLMFTPEEMAAVTKMFAVYDNYDEHKPTTTTKDDLIDIFGNTPQPTVAEPKVVKLPNLYCGSIVYYSPQTWLVTINGVKLIAAKNNPGSEFFISEISRREIVVVWKPHSLNDVPDKWNQKTDNGKNLPQDINVDVANGTITLNMRPNQTFIPDTLEIREGLIKSNTDGGFFNQIKHILTAAQKRDIKNGQ